METSVTLLVLTAIMSYLLGSVPFGLVVARAMGLPDPRTIGSKNIGATNILRTGSKTAAATTVLLDGAKGLVAALIAGALFGPVAAQIAALFAFLGHVYSLFLTFKGGKGVATAFGGILALSPLTAGVAAALWLATAIVTRYSSLSALVAAIAAPSLTLLFGRSDIFIVVLMMAALLICKHRANIARLRAGTESRIGSK